MRGLGTIINVLAIAAGSGLGLLFKKGISERFRSIMTQACGLAVVFIGIGGALEMMLTLNESGSIVSGGGMLIVFSLLLGGLCGELINIEKRLDSIGEKIKSKVKRNGDSQFVEGFVTASLVVCVGAMAICGPIDEALTGNSTTLIIKSILDFIIVMVFSSVYGVGVIFSALAVGIYQGFFTVFGVLIQQYMTPEIITALSGIGSILIFSVGVNLIRPKTIRVGNFLPALIVPILYYVARYLLSLCGIIW